MKPLWLSPFRFLDGLVDRIVVISGALIFGQFPQFYGEYLQRLGGHLAEARYQLMQYTQAAESHHLTLQEYIRVHLESGNGVFASTGQVINALVQRVDFLETTYRNFQNAPAVYRVWIFIHRFDSKIASETWFNYNPGIPLNDEGLVYALIGLLFAWGIYYFIKNVFRFVFSRHLVSPGIVEPNLGQRASR